MQFKAKINVSFNTFDGFGQPTVTSTGIIRCVVISHSRSTSINSNGMAVQYDLTVIAPYKSFDPYTSLVKDSGLRFTYQDIAYAIAKASPISDANGKTKYIRLDFLEDVK